ncbi:PstS family phosphate ABC transporter substrate-binding protein [Azoarcus sp. KH32C]|uniref:PstS family phosphate ABC transporter substrate-binding protein n=1 Tax=Azoarcus sp. KH32C TaxID=748247 RepID=UPI0002385E16|nr:substrate-binding domain-containing protein [Azoarcus sp. KH32C]BAL27201.1 ABC-type phosphate transport system periplasmic component-like protein, phosphate transport system substrate-binding protein [Azoarcus sp. KH32C]
MSYFPVVGRIALGVVAALSAGGAVAQSAAKPPMVEWLIPAPETHVPQTPEQVEAGRKFGRELPPPEVLQPILDPALPAYEPRRDIAITGTFRGASSDVLVVLVEKWFEKFKTYHPGVTLSIAPPYAGSLGAVELIKGDLDFVFVSRELRPADIGDFKAKFGYEPTSIPVSGGSYRHFGALDAVGFFVNKDNPLEEISFAQIDAMYSTTRHRGGQAITRWGELGLGGEWADKPIRRYGIKPWNGFEEFVRQRVLSKDGRRGEWRDDITMEKLVFPMAKHVADDRYGIGYSGLAYIDAAVKMIPVVANAGDPPQAPTYENVALATYPLSRLIFLNVNKAPGKPLPHALEEFLRFILSREGQQVVLDHARYIPLRMNQAQNARALFAN